MRDYEKLARKKGEEIAALQQKVSELQRKNKFSIEKEVKRLGLLLSEADNALKQKDKTVAELEAKIEELMEENYNAKGKSYTQHIDTENKSLKEKVKELEEEKAELKTIVSSMEEKHNKKATALASEEETMKKMQKELLSVYKNIANLSNTITAMMKGEEPNMQSLWEAPSAEESGKKVDVGRLKAMVNAIRTNICDYYAEKYSNECNIQ
eukprot:TRINITY_DN11703_c0_g1_i3.p1 TRINITY_DN11703_c0_g1~~TRINITY_DN11703_c0_g1_i3.p1  ORF type:complete len:210 (-),score=82.06 TRINITY_DN11703_c0_g1_i3:127-756(-)